MIAKDIQELHKHIDDFMRRDRVDDGKEDLALANMGRSPGWEIYRRKMENLIASLLEEVVFEPATPSDVRLATYESRHGIIDAVRALVSYIDTTVAADRIMKSEKQGASDTDRAK